MLKKFFRILLQACISKYDNIFQIMVIKIFKKLIKFSMPTNVTDHVLFEYYEFSSISRLDDLKAERANMEFWLQRNLEKEKLPKTNNESAIVRNICLAR